MTGKLEQKVAIITGASAGIGEATAITLASVGATVVLAARRGDRIQALTQRIEASGGKALPIVTNVTDETQVNNLVAKANAEWERAITPLQSEDVAGAIVYAVTQPPRVNVNEILIRPTGQEH